MGYFRPNMHFRSSIIYTFSEEKTPVTGTLHTSVSVVVLADVLSKATFSRYPTVSLLPG